MGEEQCKKFVFYSTGVKSQPVSFVLRVHAFPALESRRRKEVRESWWSAKREEWKKKNPEWMNKRKFPHGVWTALAIQDRDSDDEKKMKLECEIYMGNKKLLYNGMPAHSCQSSVELPHFNYMRSSMYDVDESEEGEALALELMKTFIETTMKGFDPSVVDLYDMPLPDERERERERRERERERERDR